MDFESLFGLSGRKVELFRIYFRASMYLARTMKESNLLLEGWAQKLDNHQASQKNEITFVIKEMTNNFDLLYNLASKPFDHLSFLCNPIKDVLIVRKSQACTKNALKLR